jgi:hypothetical protein
MTKAQWPTKSQAAKSQIAGKHLGTISPRQITGVIMPLIEAFTCDRCEFRMPTGWGGHTYAVDGDGQRILCPHPVEGHTIQRVTGMQYGEASAAGRVGLNSDCVCLNCFKQFHLDLKRDIRRCLFCFSPNVKSTQELIDQRCPACKRGTIRRGYPIRWPRDADRESLPVPQIVRNICWFAQTRKLPASLRAADAAIRAIPGTKGYELVSVCVHLLGWWEGKRSAKDSDAAEPLGPYDIKWPWVKGFVAAVDATPELRRLLRWDDGRLLFRDEVTADERRGIRNFVREHYKPPIMT